MFLNFLSVWISFNLIATNAYANVTNKDHRRYDKQDAEVILKVIKNLKEIIMVDNEDHPRGSKRTNEIIKIKNVILENADTDSYYVLVNGEKVNSSRIFIQNTDGLYIRLDTNATSLVPVLLKFQPGETSKNQVLIDKVLADGWVEGMDEK